MINKEIQDYIDYLLFLKYDRQLVWSNTTIAEMSDKHVVLYQIKVIAYYR